MAQKGEAGWEGPWSHLRVLLGEEVDEAEASVRAGPVTFFGKRTVFSSPKVLEQNIRVSELPALGGSGADMRARTIPTR